MKTKILIVVMTILSSCAKEPVLENPTEVVENVPSQRSTVLNTKEAVYIRNGMNLSSKNFDTSKTFNVKGSPIESEEYVTFLKFDNPGAVSRAILKLYDLSTEGKSITLTVAYTDDSWSEKTITWDNAPLIKERIGYGVVDNRTKSFDVSEYIKKNSSQKSISFVIHDPNIQNKNVSFTRAELIIN